MMVLIPPDQKIQKLLSLKFPRLTFLRLHLEEEDAEVFMSESKDDAVMEEVEDEGSKSELEEDVDIVGEESNEAKLSMMT